VSKAIASIGTGPHEQLMRLAARSFRPFADRHGYDLHLHATVADVGRPSPWAKVPLLRDLLDRYEQVLWLDSDLVIVDPSQDVPAVDFMGLVEHTTKEGRMPNTGVWVLRSSDRMREFLDLVWAQEDLIEHPWWENAAVCRLLGYDLDPVGPARQTPWLDATTFLDPRWNSIPDMRTPGARINHYPGYKPRTRAVFMARDVLRTRWGRS
jgi:hypothetical protein